MLDDNLLNLVHTLLKECEVKFITSTDEFSALLQPSQDNDMEATKKERQCKKVKIHTRRKHSKKPANRKAYKHEPQDLPF